MGGRDKNKIEVVTSEVDMSIMNNKNFVSKLTAHDLALICVMKDASAVTPDQVAQSYAKHLAEISGTIHLPVNQDQYEEELVRPC